MTLKQQVVSLDLSKRLKKIGIKQDSLYRHVSFLDYGDGQKLWSPASWYLVPKDHVMFNRSTVDEEWCSAFTVAELGEMLPLGLTTNGKGAVVRQNDVPFIPHEISETEADARAKMLIYLIENKLITV